MYTHLSESMTPKPRSNTGNGTTDVPSPLREVVGDGVYDVWVDMLRELMPDGRTHRLSLLVASILAYAARVARSSSDSEDEDAPAYPLLAASEGMDDALPLRGEGFSDKAQYWRRHWRAAPATAA